MLEVEKNEKIQRENEKKNRPYKIFVGVKGGSRHNESKTMEIIHCIYKNIQVITLHSFTAT